MGYCNKHLFLWGTCDLVPHTCDKCGKTFWGSSCPSHKVCNDCGDKYDLCVVCGCKLEGKMNKEKE